jgi:hypothetical protein
MYNLNRAKLAAQVRKFLQPFHMHPHLSQPVKVPNTTCGAFAIDTVGVSLQQGHVCLLARHQFDNV